MDLDKRIVVDGYSYIYPGRNQHLGNNYPLFEGMIFLPKKLIDFVIEHQKTRHIYDFASGEIQEMYRFAVPLWEYSRGKPYKKFIPPLYSGTVSFWSGDFLDEELKTITKDIREMKKWGNKIRNLKSSSESGTTETES